MIWAWPHSKVQSLGFTYILVQNNKATGLDYECECVLGPRCQMKARMNWAPNIYTIGSKSD